jgi:hypothetical protein
VTSATVLARISIPPEQQIAATSNACRNDSIGPGHADQGSGCDMASATLAR